MITAVLYQRPTTGKPGALHNIVFDPLAVESFVFVEAEETIAIRTRSGDDFVVLNPEGAISAAIIEAKEEELRWFRPGTELAEGFDV